MWAYVFTLVGLLAAGAIYTQIYPLSMLQIRYAITIAAFVVLLVFFFGNAEGTRLNRFLGGLLATIVLGVGLLLILGVFQPIFAVVIFLASFAVVYGFNTRRVPPKKIYLDDNGNPVK